MIFVAVAAIDGLHRRGRGPHLHALRAARRLQARPRSAASSGSLGFSVLSFLRCPRVAWGVVAAAVLIAGAALPKVRRRDRRWRWRAVVALAGRRVGRRQHDLVAVLQDRTRPERGRRRPQVNVNGVPHQAHRCRWPTTPSTTPATHQSRQPRSSGDVLIIGAGGGNDVAVGARPRGRPRRRGGDRPRAVRAGPGRATPTTPTTTRAWTCTSTTAGPSWSARDEQYDRILLALPDSLTLVSGPVLAAAGELPVHRGGRSSPPATTSSRAASSRCTTTTASTWLIDRYAGTLDDVFGQRPVRRHARSGNRDATLAVAHRESDDPTRIGCRGTAQAVGPDRPATSRGRPPTTTRSPTCGTGRCPASTWSRIGADPAGVAGRRPRSRPGRCGRMLALRRPVLHGCGVPAAGDQERRAVRPAVRHHVVGQRAGLRRRPAVGPVRGGRSRSGSTFRRPARLYVLLLASLARRLGSSRPAPCSTRRAPRAGRRGRWGRRGPRPGSPGRTTGGARSPAPGGRSGPVGPGARRRPGRRPSGGGASAAPGGRRAPGRRAAPPRRRRPP